MGRRRQISCFAPYEADIAAAVLEHWLLLGKPGTLVACVPNAFAHGQAGLTKGLADLLVMAPGLPVGFIELKRGERSRRSDAQLAFAHICARLGVPYACTTGRDEPIAVLEAWGVVCKARTAA